MSTSLNDPNLDVEAGNGSSTIRVPEEPKLPDAKLPNGKLPDVEIKYVSKPTITALDVINEGPRPRVIPYSRAWLDLEDSSRNYEASLPTQTAKSVRIVLKDHGGASTVNEFILPTILSVFEDHATLIEDHGPIFPPASHGNANVFTRIMGKSMDAFDKARGLSFASRFRDRFDLWFLKELWKMKGKETTSSASSFVLQVNLKESLLRDEIRIPSETRTKTNTLFSEPRVFYGGFYNYYESFWESVIALETQWVDNDKMMVYCSFPVLESKPHDGGPLMDLSFPVQILFEKLLQSGETSLRFGDGDLQHTCKLVILDLFRAVISFWRLFLKDINHRQAQSTTTLSNAKNHQNDATITLSFNALVRDLFTCTTFLVSSIDAAIAKEKRREWNELVLEINTAKVSLEQTAKDIQERSYQSSAAYMAFSAEAQARSAKRLTLVAAIFLPLTLAASLMAMTTPVADVGALWYDWAGLCITIGFVVVVVYLLYRFVGNALRSSSAFLGRRVLSSKLGKWLFSEQETAFMYFYLFVLFAVIVASFLVGMFDSRPLALTVFKYGLAGFFGFMFVMEIVREIWDLSILILIIRLSWNALLVYRQLRRRGGKFSDWKLFKPDVLVSSNHELSPSEAATAADARRRLISVVLDGGPTIRSNLQRIAPQVRGLLNKFAADDPEFVRKAILMNPEVKEGLETIIGSIRI
ncbi:hypothetical protein MMC11_000653 [Xylographa trunciseda]|nr:hypothetical protein [Xylographa trunciseda]